MKIEKTIKSSFDHRKTSEILDDYFTSIKYKKTADELSLTYRRGSFGGSLFLTPKFWKSVVHINISGRKKDLIVKINANINTTGQMVIKKERDFLENEFDQIENNLSNKIECNVNEHDVPMSVNKKNIHKTSNEKEIIVLVIILVVLACSLMMPISFLEGSQWFLLFIPIFLVFIVSYRLLSLIRKSGINSVSTKEKYLNSQKNTMISLSEFPRLKAVALIFIVLGIAEILFIIDSLTSGQNFATRFIFVFYAFVGFKLLLLKRGIKLETYKNVRNLVIFIFVFSVALALFEIIDVFLFFSVKSVLLEYKMNNLSSFFIPVFFLTHLILVYLLNRPVIRQRKLILKPIKQALLIGGVILALLLMSIVSVLSGSHLTENYFQTIADEAVSNQQIKKDVGEIEKLILNRKEGASKWVLSSEWDIVGNKCRGTYDLAPFPKNEVTFQIKKLECSEDNQQTQNRDYVPSSIKDISVKQSSGSIDGILLSTSFENLDPSNLEVITPFINTEKTKWRIYAKDSKTGKYSLNVLPSGNSSEGFGSIFSGFNESKNSAIINSVFSNKYKPFDVSDYDRIEFEFWRYSSSNPRKKDDWNCAGNLDLKYRIDKGEWKTAMGYCGEHRTETRGWRFSSLTFNTKGKSTIEFKFEYDSFLIREKDSTAFYLIDDLQIKGFKDDPFILSPSLVFTQPQEIRSQETINNSINNFLLTEEDFIMMWEDGIRNDPETVIFEKLEDKKYHFKTNRFSFDGELKVFDVCLDYDYRDYLCKDEYIAAEIKLKLDNVPESRFYYENYGISGNVRREYRNDENVKAYLKWHQNNCCSFYYDYKTEKWLTDDEHEKMGCREKEPYEYKSFLFEFMIMFVIASLILLALIINPFNIRKWLK